MRHRAVLTVASVVAACVAPDDDGEAPVPLIASEELRIGSVDDSATALTYVIAFGAAVLRGSDSAGGRGHALALASFYRPPALPPVSSLLLGRDGSVWLRRENTGAKESAWWVLDVDGALYGSVAFPANASLLAAERGRVWAMVFDSLDVITRYTVAR